MTENQNHASVSIYMDAIKERKTINPILMNLSGLTSMADYFIVCSARSVRHASAIADFMYRYLKDRKKHPLGREGAADGQWHLLDYGDVVIHIFFEPAREFYDLEGLWSDAGIVSI